MRGFGKVLDSSLNEDMLPIKEKKKNIVLSVRIRQENHFSVFKFLTRILLLQKVENSIFLRTISKNIIKQTLAFYFTFQGDFGMTILNTPFNDDE